MSELASFGEFSGEFGAAARRGMRCAAGCVRDRFRILKELAFVWLGKLIWAVGSKRNGRLGFYV